MKEQLEPYIDTLKAFVQRGSGKLQANELHELGVIWNKTHGGVLDPSCGACVFRMCKQLVSWYDVN